MGKKVQILNTIYIIKNRVNNKVYVGQTWWSLKNRWNNGHGYLNCLKLHNAIQKYGKDNFYYEALTFCATQEIANYWESHFIHKYNSINEGYNIANGGRSVMRGRRHSVESIKKMSKSHEGNTAHLNKAHSFESRKKISEATKRQIKKNGHPSLGHKHSDECKKKISQNRKGIRACIRTEFKPLISLEIAENIRQEKKSGITNQKLATKYNISATLVSLIINNKRWV